MGDYYYEYHDEGEEDLQDKEEEETLSLCDLPLNQSIDKENGNRNIKKSSSDFFEFLTTTDHVSSEMSSAEDLIFCGKLIPFKHLSPPIQSQLHLRKEERDPISIRRRSESFSGLMPHSSSNKYSKKTTLMRSSRSLKLEMLSTPKSKALVEVGDERSYSTRSNAKGDVTAKKAAKPRWFVLMFGLVRPLSQEMELRDIKSRQIRLNPSKMFLPSQSKKQDQNPCRLIRALSCKGQASVGVATSTY